MKKDTTIKEIVEDINLNIRKNCNAMICSVCGGGGYNYDKERDCTECLASGITNWDFDFLNKQLTQTLQTERQKREEMVEEEKKQRWIVIRDLINDFLSLEEDRREANMVEMRDRMQSFIDGENALTKPNNPK